MPRSRLASFWNTLRVFWWPSLLLQSIFGFHHCSAFVLHRQRGRYLGFESNDVWRRSSPFISISRSPTDFWHRHNPAASFLASSTLTDPSPRGTKNRSPRRNNNNKNSSWKRRRQGHGGHRGRNEIRGLFRRAKDLERKGQWRKALGIFEDILELDPADAHTHLALARLEARREAPELHAASASNSSSATLIVSGNNRAARAFERGTLQCPKSVHLWQAWAVYEDSRGHTDKARELFERALLLDEYNPYVCHAYGLLELRMENSKKAAQLMEKALQKSSTAALVCSLGELWISNSEYHRARDLYFIHLHALETEREKTEVYLAWAWLEERYFQNSHRAVELIQMSLEMSPTSSRAQVALARLEGRRRAKQEQEHQGGKRHQSADEQKPTEEGSNPTGGEQLRKEATARRLANTCMCMENGVPGARKPSDGRVYNAWANIQVKARRFRAARKILGRGLQRYPRDHSLLQAAGKVEERVGNYSGARSLYSASLLVEPSAPTLVAYALLDLKHPGTSGPANFTKVRRLFEEALLLDPRHGPAYNAYARSVLRQQEEGSLDEARLIFERGVRAKCYDASSIYHGYAKLELSMGNVNRSRELLLRGRRKAQRQDLAMDSPHRERALFLSHTLGMLELNRDRPSDALKVFRDGIERYGNNSLLLLGAALCEVKLENEDTARELFKLAVVNDHKHAHAWQAWGVMEMRAGNRNTAKTLFECGIKSAPRHGALWHAFATMESRWGNVDEARALFQNGIKHARGHVPLYQSWASLELREGNFGSAKTLITEALTRDKRNGAGWLVAAEIEERSGNDGLVTLILRRGIECSPADGRLYRALGTSLLRGNKVNEAREILEKGIEVDPTHAPLYHSLAELEASVFNIEGLARLNKRAAEIFNTDALKRSSSSSETWGARIRAGRQRRADVPRGVSALAERIVEEEEGITDEPLSSALSDKTTNPDDFLDQMSANLIEDGLVRQLLEFEEEKEPPSSSTTTPNEQT